MSSILDSNRTLICRFILAALLAVLVSFGMPARPSAAGRPSQFDNIHTSQCQLGCKLCHCLLDEDS